MRRRLKILMITGSFLWPAWAFAQTQPPQITQEDLLRMIGLQQVQNLQCGKMLDAVQQQLQTIETKMKKLEPSKDVK